jgi:hypothetical protein
MDKIHDAGDVFFCVIPCKIIFSSINENISKKRGNLMACGTIGDAV